MFTLKIETGNAAFREFGCAKGDEVTRILEEIASKLRGADKMGGPVKDSNGNTVGSYKLT